MYYKTANGRIYYEVKGEGPGVLLLHGLGGSLDSMYAISDVLEDYRSVLVDIPCHGKSDDFAISFKELAGLLVSLMKELGHEKFYVIGISLGSLISETMLINFPDSIIKAAFLSPASHIDEQAVRTVFDWFNSEDGGARSLFSEKFYETHKEEIMEYEKNHPLVPGRLFNLVNEIMNFNIQGERSGKKCIIIYGQFDNLFGERMISTLKIIFKNCKISRMSTGHAIHREAPQEAAKIINSYFMDE